MAKRHKMARTKEPEEKEARVNPYGTTSDMVVKEDDDGTVICKDEKGYYRTEKHWIDTHLLDPWRVYRRTQLGKIDGSSLSSSSV